MQQTIDSEVFYDSPTSNKLMTYMDPDKMKSIEMLALSLLNDLMWNTVAHEPRHSISGNRINTYKSALFHSPDTSRYIEEDDDKKQ